MFDHLDPKRRTVLKALIASAIAFFVAPFAYAIDRYLSFTGSVLNGESARVAQSELSGEGASQIIDISGEPVVVVHEPSGIRAFTATCTHMGCTVRYRSDHNDFYCRCHQGRFDADGVNVPGTKPPSPLTELVVHERGADLEIVLTPKPKSAT